MNLNVIKFVFHWKKGGRNRKPLETKKHAENGTRSGITKINACERKEDEGARNRTSHLKTQCTCHVQGVHFCQHSSGEEFSPSHVGLALATEFLIHHSLAEING